MGLWNAFNWTGIRLLLFVSETSSKEVAEEVFFEGSFVDESA